LQLGRSYCPRRDGSTRYELSPGEGGTLVREAWDVSRDRPKRMITSGSMPKQTEHGMRGSLERIAKPLES
jgi:hypothetical protein